MPQAFRIEIRPTIHDTREDVFSRKIQKSGLNGKVVGVADIYTVNKDFSKEEQEKAAKMLINEIIESATTQGANAPEQFDYAVEVAYLPGVTDNLAHTVIETMEDGLKCEFNRPDEDVYSSFVLFLEGVSSKEEARKIGLLFANELVNRVEVKGKASFDADGGMGIRIPKVELHHSAGVDTVDLNVSDEELQTIGKKGIPNGDGTYRGPLALRLSYLHTIRDYFQKEGRMPTDLELESIAQTWSEHCKHTIFADPIDEIEDGIFKHYIRRATVEIRKAKGENDFCVSVFKDNSGGIIFDENYVVTDKAETHNTPSALEPFGGAITGIVGVNRDALGYGKGAKPVINRYGFCFGDPDSTKQLYRGKNKANPALHPKTIMEGVIKGVNAGGNESGIPTPQGFMYIDERYSGKPLVFVGTIGLIPRTINGENASEKSAQPGDKIVVAGGRVGLDGIHGATFSSEALDTGSPSTAVQIGDPITQKKLSDVIIKEARDADLYSSITDNGAGGISCSIAEMARECGGCEVELEKVPLKYPNLSPWEIWTSESQERMTFAVAPEKLDAFMDLMKRRDVEATVVGTFNDSGRCVVKHNGEKVMNLQMSFLHDGLPAEKQVSSYSKPTIEEPTFEAPTNLKALLLEMLSRKNIASTRFISRQFDHEVQGGSVIKPLQGEGLVNGTAAVTRPVLDSPKAVVTAQALNPNLTEIDAYAMAECSIDDAVAAAVAVGGNIDYMAMMDNFCWCSSEEPERLGQLKEAAKACYDMAVEYGVPYISGKDSMFNDFKGYDENNNPVEISVPPTLLISTMGVIPQADKAVSLDFKQAGDLIFLLGETKHELAASEYYQYLKEKGVIENSGASVPRVQVQNAFERYRKLYQSTQEDLINSMIHLEKGGLGIALAKACIAGQLGASIDLSAANQNTEGMDRSDLFLFAESKSRFLISIHPSNKEAFMQRFPNASLVGEVTEVKELNLKTLEAESLTLSVDELTQAYHSTFKDY